MAIKLKRFIFNLHRRDRRLGDRSRRTSAPVRIETITNWNVSPDRHAQHAIPKPHVPGRPCERRDPYAADSRFRYQGGGLFSLLRPGVVGPWVRRDDWLKRHAQKNSVCDSSAQMQTRALDRSALAGQQCGPHSSHIQPAGPSIAKPVIANSISSWGLLRDAVSGFIRGPACGLFHAGRNSECFRDAVSILSRTLALLRGREVRLDQA